MEGEGCHAQSVAPRRQVDALAEQMTETRLLKLPPGCGHAPRPDQEAQVLAALAAFVGQL
jgi:hypothetical protein